MTLSIPSLFSTALAIDSVNVVVNSFTAATGVDYAAGYTITGTTVQGATLSAWPLPSSLSGLTLSYQWYADGTAINGATSSSLTLAQAQVGKTISVIASYTDGDGTPGSVVSASTGAVENVLDDTTGSVLFSGLLKQGSRLTVLEGTLADLDGVGTFHYQWRAGNEPIAGAIGSTLLLTQDQVGKTIAVDIRYTDSFGNQESFRSSVNDAIAVLNVNDAPTGAVTIGGAMTLGAMLTASNTLADLDGLGTIRYQWHADGAPIDGATHSTLEVSSELLGKTISVIASYTDGQGTLEAVSSASSHSPTGSVTIRGVLNPGGTLTASNTLADLDGIGTVSYQWRVNGMKLPDGTLPTLDISAGTVNAVAGFAGQFAVDVIASYVDAQGSRESVTSATVMPFTGVTLIGTAQQGETLFASTTLASTGPVAYEWRADGQTIPFIYGSSLTLTQSLVGKSITAVVSYIDGLGSLASVSSAPSAAVANVNDGPIRTLEIIGTRVVGETLTAWSTLEDPDGMGATRYRWYSNDVAINGATASTLTLTPDLAGTWIRVLASYTDSTGVDESMTVTAGSLVGLVDHPTTGTVTISGDLVQGQTLTASSTLADLDGLTSIGYQWYADDAEIAGATGSTLIPGQAQVGKTIRVDATYTDGWGATGTVTTASAGVITNVNDSPTGSVTISGVLEQNRTLAASDTLADPDGIGTIRYQWFANGIAIAGQTASTLTLVQAQVGKTISVIASYTDDGGTLESVMSASTSAVQNVLDAPTGSPLFSGLLKQGSTLTVMKGTLADLDGLGALHYDWYADTEAIAGANSSSLLLTQDQVGKVISVFVTYTDGLGIPQAKLCYVNQAVPVINVNDAPTGAVTINGAMTVGATLTASNTLADLDGPGTIRYQWRADGVPIDGATNSTLTVSNALLGKTISVIASYTDGQGTLEAVSSASSHAPTGSVSISGVLNPGGKLIASNTLADLDGMGAVSYQWRANDYVIPDEVMPTMTVSEGTVVALIQWDGQVGFDVTASYVDAQGTRTTVTSETVVPSEGVLLIGTAQQGETLFAPTSLAWVGPVSYQWLADGQKISGETGSSLTLTQALVGKSITALVSYVDGMGSAASITSMPSTTVTNVNDGPTGTVSISGTRVLGATLTASNTLADQDGLGSISYRWYSNGVGIDGATASTLKLTQDHVGTWISVLASYTDAMGANESVTVTADGSVGSVDNPTTGTVTINGDPVQGQTLTASSTLADLDGLPSIRYQWYANGAAIAGATASTLSPGQAQVGKTIHVEVSYTDGWGSTGTVITASTDVITDVNDSPTGAVTISGVMTQGQTLTASNTLADLDGIGTIGYQWKANGSAIAGATGSTLVLTQALVGKTISVMASYTDGLGSSEAVISASTEPIANVNDAPTGAVTISGNPIQGETLTASTTLADLDGIGTIRYQWSVYASARVWSEESELTLTQEMVGMTIRVTASYTDAFGMYEMMISEPSAAVANVNDAPTGSVTISGTPTQGATLTASNTLTDLDGIGTIRYQWKANGSAIAGASGSTLVLTQAQVGKAITVQASYTDALGASESVSSAPTSQVANVNDAPTGTLYMVGRVRQGETLTVSSTVADLDGLGSISHQWFADDVALDGETGPSLLLSRSLVGKSVKVVASYTDAYGAHETVSSVDSSTIAFTNQAPSGSVTISGNAQQGQTLTASSTLADTDGLGDISYQWFAAGLAIEGATGSTLTLTKAQVGKAITVVASYVDDHMTQEAVSSAATSAVLHASDSEAGLLTISGTAKQGEWLSASSAVAGQYGSATVSYQWYANGMPIVGASEATLKLTQYQVGQSIGVLASYQNGADIVGSIASASTAAVANINDAPTGSVLITGATRVGQTLTASNTLADADGLGSIHYQWYAGDHPIADASMSTLTLGQAQLGKSISVVASYTDALGATESVTGVATTPALVTAANASPSGAITITGYSPPYQNATLTAVSTLADRDGLGTLSYQWYANGVAIHGATGSTLTLAQAQVGKAIRVVASYTDGLGVHESVASASTSAVQNRNDGATGEAFFTGLYTQRSTLTVMTGTVADPEGLGTFQYQWYADSDPIAGATSTTLLLTEKQVGKVIWVEMSYTDGAGAPEVLAFGENNATVSNDNDAPTGALKISGTPVAGATLTASQATLLDADGLGTLSYQWRANGVEIAGATGTTLILSNDLVGKAISVVASYTDGHGTRESVSSASTHSPTGAVTINGRLDAAGGTLTASNTLADLDGLGTITYQWRVSGVEAGTGATFALSRPGIDGWTSYLGPVAVDVVASYVDAQGTRKSVTSARVTPEFVSLIGTAKQGEILVASTPLASTGAVGYAWQADGEPISGAIEPTLTLTQAQVGKVISVAVSYTNALGAAASVSSTLNTEVANVNDSPTGTVSIDGARMPGQTLTARSTLADLDGLGPVSYQWYSNGVAIDGAIGSTLALTQDHLNRSIGVMASYTDGFGTHESVAITPIGVVSSTDDPTTGGISITGPSTPFETHTLTAESTLTDPNGIGDLSYQWFANSMAIPGATGSSLTLGQAQVGKTISVIASATDGVGTSLSFESASTIAIRNAEDVSTGALVISGVHRQGSTLTVLQGTLDNRDGLGEFSYQWYANGVAIPGATASTLLLTQTQGVDQSIRVRVQYTSGVGQTKTSWALANLGAPVIDLNDAPTGSVTISAATQAGVTLTASNTLTDLDGMGTVSYQWRANGAEIAGASTSTLTLTNELASKTISVVASYTDGNGTLESVSSASTHTPTGTVSISGSLSPLGTLTASNNLADLDGLGAISYQWRISGIAPTEANTDTLTLTQSLYDAYSSYLGPLAIDVVASYVDAQGTRKSVASATVLATPEVTLLGTAQQGSTVSAPSALASIGPVSYEWRADGQTIRGATAPTLTLTQAHVGHEISVILSYTTAQGSAASVSSAMGQVVANVNDSPTGTVTITGARVPGETLSASNTLADPDGLGTIRYRWYANGVGIDGATASTLTLTPDQIGKIISVVASYTDGYGANEAVIAKAADVIASANHGPTGSVTIGGDLTQGGTLTATNTLADLDTLGTISYQWYAHGLPIAGATGSTLSLGQDQVGQAIRVKASYTDGLGFGEAVISAATEAVANASNLPTGSVTIDGVLTQGATLTASNTLADLDGLGTIGYQWYANGIAIAGATASTLTLGQAQVGKTIRVLASYADGDGTLESVASASTSAIQNIEDKPTGTPLFSGLLRQGSTLTVFNGTLADLDGLGAFKYRWYSGSQLIAGASSSTLTLTQDQVGKTISVKIGYTDSLGTTEIGQYPVNDALPVINVNDAPTGAVTISGAMTLGATLTASNTLADLDGLGTIGYQWRANGVDIPGASNSTLTLSDALLGKTISVIASYTDDQHTLEAVSSASSHSPTGSVTIRGVLNPAGDLFASSTLADLDGMGTVSYQWRINDYVIPDGVMPILTVSQGTINAYMEWDGQVGFDIIASTVDAQGTRTTVTSAMVIPPAEVKIIGTAQEGETLFASTALVGAGQIRYRWLADGQLISGETGSSLTLTQSLVGKAITSSVLYVDGLGFATTVLSTPSTAVANVNNAPTGSLTFSGARLPGTTLTVSSTLADRDGLGEISYRWYSNGVAIDGATTSTLMLTQNHLDHPLSVLASCTDGFGAHESVLVSADRQAPEGDITISGKSEPFQNDTLTAVSTLSDANGMGTLSYQWFANGIAIAGATASTLVLGQAQVGKTISVIASYTDGEGTIESVASASTSAVQNVLDDPTGSALLSGLLKQGSTLTVLKGTLADLDGLGSLHYDWYADTDAIAGANASTLLLTQNEVGKIISVFVSYTDGLGIPEAKLFYVNKAVPVININDAPTGAVTISGAMTLGATLTASNTLADLDGLGTIGYQWRADGVPIDGAVNSTLTVSNALLGKTISVVASYTDGQGTREAVSSASSHAPTGSVSISGVLNPGGTLTASNTLADLDGMGTVSYQWRANNYVIPDEVMPTMTVSTGTVGSVMQWDGQVAFDVIASYVDAQGTRATVTSATVVPPTGVLLVGSAREGETLFAPTPLAWVGPVSYQWLADGQTISGETGSSLTLTQALVGNLITAKMSFIDGSGSAASITSLPSAIVSNVNDSPTGTVSISGTRLPGATLTASNTLADQDGIGTISYRWYSNGVGIDGATASTLTLTQDHVGTWISVLASYTDAFGAREAVVGTASGVIIDVNHAPTGSVTINGDPAQGKTLTASNTLADLDGVGAVSYQWYANGSAIAGATGAALSLGQTLVGKTIRVTASYTDAVGSSETVNSASSGAVANVNDAPTGTVTISGVMTQGQTLTASNALADIDGLGTISYQWRADGNAINGAGGATLVLTQAQVGTAISVIASYTDLLGTKESIASADSVLVANVNDAPTGTVTISGVMTQGETLTASNTLTDLDGLGAITYQWTADGSAINGASGATLVLTQALVGKAISVVASYTDTLGAKESVTSADSALVANVNDAPTGTVTISGVMTQGETLTGSNTLADLDGLGTITYQWKADGSAINGATAATLTLTQAQVGKTISVVASYTDPLGAKESVTSSDSALVANLNDAPTGTVTIGGVMTQGQTLTASNALADIDGLGTISYQWRADGGALSGATGSTLVLSQAQVGKAISVVASYIDALGTKESIASADSVLVANVNDAPTGTVTISGVMTQGETLTASNTLADLDGLDAISYQWTADGVSINGASGAALALTQALVGKAISVVASYTDLLGAKESIASADSALVANVNDAPIGVVTISGSMTQGQTLTASNTLADIDGLGAISYQWKADGSAINGATAATLTLTQAQVGKTISVVASYTDTLGAKESVASADSALVANVNDAPTGAVTISGAMTQGQTLTASNALADIDGLGTISYQWTADGSAINGATAATLILNQAQVGKAISVVASYTDALGVRESVESATGNLVVNVNDSPTGAVTVSGVMTQGETLTASNALADLDGLGTITYQWKADGSAISGTSGSNLVLTQTLVGKAISVVASYTDALGARESVESATGNLVVNVNDSPTGAVTVSGLMTQGETLTASNTLADLDGLGTISYQWRADGSAINGATAATLTLNQAQVGKAISVVASYTDTLGAKESIASADSALVANVNDAPTGTVTISGVTTQGQTLTASNTLADIDGLGTITYQWKADGSAINGATATTLTLTQAEVGKAISVIASYTDALSSTEAVGSSTTSRIADINDAALGSVSITGTAGQGLVLRATVSVVYDLDGLPDSTLEFSYQWSADGALIGGVVGDQLLLSPDLVGKTISVRALFRDAAAHAEVLQSSPTSAVAAGSFDGHINYWSAQSSVSDASIAIWKTESIGDGRTTLQSVSKASGQWKFDELDFDRYTLHLSKVPSTADQGAVNAADVLSALKLALGLNPNPDPDGAGPEQPAPVSPYQLIAADATADGEITIEDVAAIERMAFGDGRATVCRWVFLDQSTDLTTVSSKHVNWQVPDSTDASADTASNWTGVLVGDVDGSWRTSLSPLVD